MPELAGPLLDWPSLRDAVLLIVLAIACTLLPFSLSFVALRHISAFSAQLAINLEPVYTIVLAVVLLGEQRDLTVQFYVGVAIILAGVSLQPVFGRPREVAAPTGA
jgi:drug/metabolite transporter (DMT)-like permease